MRQGSLVGTIPGSPVRSAEKRILQEKTIADTTPYSPILSPFSNCSIYPCPYAAHMRLIASRQRWNSKNASALSGGAPSPSMQLWVAVQWVPFFLDLGFLPHGKVRGKEILAGPCAPCFFMVSPKVFYCFSVIDSSCPDNFKVHSGMLP